MEGKALVLLWESYVGGQQSLGIVGENTILALDEEGFNVKPVPWNLSRALKRMFFSREEDAAKAGYPWGDSWWQAVAPRTRELVLAATSGVSIEEERRSVALTWGWLAQLGNAYWRHAKLQCGYAYYDYTTLPQHITDALNRRIDVLFVPSEFVRRNVVNAGVGIPVVTWPHGVDANVFTPKRGPRSGDSFTFLFNGVAQERKGVKELLRAFARAFDHEDVGVRLIVKSADWGDLEEFRREYTDPRIEWIYAQLSAEEVVALYHKADCFVLPSRAEAFGLPVLEAMACGLPVVVTAYGGYLDFCSADVGYLVPVRRMQATLSGVEARLRGYDQVPEWAVIDEDALVDVLRYVRSHPLKAREKGERGAEVARLWSWRAGVKRVAGVLESLGA